MLGSLIYGLLYIWLFTMRRIGWFRWSVEGLERLPPRESGGMIVVMNHVNQMDIPVIGALLPFRYQLSWLGKAELFRHPFIRWLLHTMQVIPIRRGRRDAAAMEAVVNALRGGAVLLIFPEGTRSHNGVLRAGRGGAVRMALQAGVPIVPIAVVGTEHGFGGSLRRRPVHMRIGQPYMVVPNPDGSVPSALMDQLTDEMMGRIAALLPPERRGPYAARLSPELEHK
jgi:1-acyl-sn-glycerol-3-phosphate acyltransferase